MLGQLANGPIFVLGVDIKEPLGKERMFPMANDRDLQAEVEQLTQEGLSDEEIASQLGLTEQGVQAWRLTSEGLSDEEIATRLGIDVETVSRIKQPSTE